MRRAFLSAEISEPFLETSADLENERCDQRATVLFLRIINIIVEVSEEKCGVALELFDDRGTVGGETTS